MPLATEVACRAVVSVEDTRQCRIYIERRKAEIRVMDILRPSKNRQTDEGNPDKHVRVEIFLHSEKRFGCFLKIQLILSWNESQPSLTTIL